MFQGVSLGRVILVLGCWSVGGNFDAVAETISAARSTSCVHTAESFKCIEFVHNYDGDSLTFNIPNVHPLFGDHMKVRIGGINTAEMRTIDSCERNIAERAQVWVQKELENARRIDLTNMVRGKYFRIVADVIYDGKSLGERLLKLRLGVPYDGGTKPIVDWCNL